MSSVPACGADPCDARATQVDEYGVGFCAEHAFDSCVPVEADDQFDPWWIAASLGHEAGDERWDDLEYSQWPAEVWPMRLRGSANALGPDPYIHAARQVSAGSDLTACGVRWSTFHPATLTTRHPQTRRRRVRCAPSTSRGGRHHDRTIRFNAGTNVTNTKARTSSTYASTRSGEMEGEAGIEPAASRLVGPRVLSTELLARRLHATHGRRITAGPPLASQ